MTEPTDSVQLSGISKIRQKLKPVSLLVFSGAQILDVVNMTGLIFSATEIAFKYNIKLSEASWIISAYSLTFGSFILFGGRMADYVGHRTMFTLGMLIVALCSLINGCVQNVYVLFVFRAIQGLGAALSIPTSFSLVAHTFTGRSQALAFALVGSAAAMGGIIGVLVGGGFTKTTIGYRGLMFLSLGLSFAFAAAVYFVVEETPHDKKQLRTIDYPGIFIVVAGMILVVFGFTSAPGSWKTAKVITTIIIGVILLAFFAIYETFYAQKWFKVEPLLPRFVWNYTNVPAVFALAPLHFANLYVIMFEGTNLAIEIRKKTPLAAAIQFIPMGIAFALACVVGGALFGKAPTRLIFAIASVFEIIAGALMAQAGHQSYWQYFFPGVLFCGLGTALFMATFVNVVSNSAPLKHQGLVSGVCMTGGLLGTSIALAIATSEVGSAVELKGYQDAFYTLVAYGGLSVILAIFFVKDYKGKVGDQKNHELNNGDATVDSAHSLNGDDEEAKDNSGTDALSNGELAEDDASNKV
jgi:MFS family permease